MDETCCDLRGDRCGAGRRGRRGRGGNGCAHPPPARAPATRGRRQRHFRAAGGRQAQPHQPDGPLRTGYLSAGRPAARGCAAASSTCRPPTDQLHRRRGRRPLSRMSRARSATSSIDAIRRRPSASAPSLTFGGTNLGGSATFRRHQDAGALPDTTCCAATPTSRRPRRARSRSRTCRRQLRDLLHDPRRLQMFKDITVN